MGVRELCAWLEQTPIGVMVKETTWGFPILVTIHLVGLIASVGTLLWFDLRLLGVAFERRRATEIYRRLLPVMVVGFTTMFVSGGLLFTGFATGAYENIWFRIKVSMMLIAAINATIYHLRIERTLDGLEQQPSARWPAGARLAGLISLIAWMTVTFAGRMMSYTMF